MRIVFLGDISVSKSHSYSIDRLSFLRDADHVIANLEGPILTESEISLIKKKNRRVLYNSPDVIDVLSLFNIDVLCLANNHIFDHANSLQFTKGILEESGIGCFGAGGNLAEAKEPYIFHADNQKIMVYGFGWDVIGCQYAAKGRPGVNPYEPDHLMGTIRELRKKDPSSIVIYYIHWNYELEGFPQPADRQLARKLIDEGVDAILGLHPHVPQGAELYQGKPIVYSLGNWFFPPRKFGPVTLNFSRETAQQIALEVNAAGGNLDSMVFHWLQFDCQSKSIQYKAAEAWEGETLARLTPFSGISDSEYVSWFRKNNSKRYSLPIYRDHSLRAENWIKDQYVKLRQRMVWLLVKMHLKK